MKTNNINNIESANDYGINAGSAIYDKNISRFYPTLWHWLINGSFVFCMKNEDCARYICGPEHRGRVDNICMKTIGQTIEMAAMGMGVMIQRGQMSKRCCEAVADLRRQFLRRCQSRKYDRQQIAVYEFDDMFIVAPIWNLLSNSQVPAIHETNY